MEHQFILESLAEHTSLQIEQLRHLLRCIDMQWSRAPQQSESRDKPHQSKTMVTMQMRDEHGVYLAEMDTALAQLQLGALTTVHHEKLVVHLNKLCRGIML